MDWQEIKGAFLQDGSLRDIYILGSDLDDWPTIWQVLKTSEYKLRLSRGGEVQPLPTDIRQVIHYELGYLLQVDVGGAGPPLPLLSW
jgi:hypothetical protein